SAAVISGHDVLQPEDFPADFLLPRSPAALVGQARDQATNATAGNVAGEDLSFLGLDDYREAKRRFEIAYITAKLREHAGNITRTAAAIGLHRQSLQEKLRELGVSAGRR